MIGAVEKVGKVAAALSESGSETFDQPIQPGAMSQ